MPATRLELMHDHVRAIHRSVTGEELPEPRVTAAANDSDAPSFAEVAHRFAELEAAARARPSLAERVPPFSFAPPLDVIGTARELVFELGVPGVERGDVEVTLNGGELVVSGARANQPATEGRIYFHAEMPRGPFRRVIALPDSVSGPPRFEIGDGIVRIKLARATPAPLPRA